MAVFKATQNKSDSSGKFKATKNRSYDSTLVSGWETSSKEAYEELEKYRRRINNGEYLSADDLTAYQKALDRYVESSTSLRGVSRALGQSSNDVEWTRTVSQMKKGYNDISNYYSQWKTEDSYKSAIASSKEREEKLSLDTNAYSSEIKKLEAQREALIQEFDAADVTTGTEAGDRARSEFLKKLDALDKQIQDKKVYLKDASRLQEGVQLASVSGNKDFNENSGYVSTEYGEGFSWDKIFNNELGLGYDDLTYEYINNQNGMRDKINQKYRAYSSDNNRDGESIYQERGYDQMTEDEVAIYNYYYSKEGKAAAEKYLNSIQETLNSRKAAGMFENLEDNVLLELAFGVAAGLDQFESGMKGLANAITGNDEYVAPSATQIASGMVREDLSDVDLKWYNIKDKEWGNAKIFGNSLGQTGYDAVTTTSNMLPSIMTSTVANIVAPGSGAVIGTGLLGASAGGNAYQEMVNLGYDKGQARAYAALVGGSEAILQYALGGISKLGGGSEGIFQTVAGKLLPHVDKAFVRTAIKLGSNMLDEGLEEGLQEILTPWFQNLVLNADANVDWSEVAYSSLLGALTAGVMEGPGTIYGEVNAYTQGRKLLKSDFSAERLAELGKTFAADTEAYRLAGKVNENTDAYTIGRLFKEIGATMTEQNVNDITRALVDKGMTEDIAKKNAEVMAYIIAGGELSDIQMKMIQNNDVLATVMKDVIIDPNSTVNQRTKGYNEALMTLAKEKAGAKSSKENLVQQGETNAPISDTVDATNKTATESHYEVSDDGKMVNIETGDVIEPQGLVKASDGTYKIAVKDADPVTTSNVRYSNGNEALVYETFVNLEGRYGKTNKVIGSMDLENRNALLGLYNPEINKDGGIFANGAVSAFFYGHQGIDLSAVPKTSPVWQLTEQQRKIAWNQGRIAGVKATNTAQSNVDTVYEEAQKVLKQTGAKKGSYHAVLEDGITPMQLNEKQKAVYRVADDIAQGVQTNIRVYAGKNKAQGFYNHATDEIWLNLNAANQSREAIMAFTLAHELVHRGKKGSPAKYKAFVEFLMKEYGKQGTDVEALIAEQMAAAEAFDKTVPDSKKINMTREKAFEEVVCDACQRMLLDTNAGQKLAEFGAQSKQNKSFLEDLKRWISEFFEKLRNYFKGVDPDSKAAKEFAKFDENVKQILADMYVDMSIDAGEKLSTIKAAYGGAFAEKFLGIKDIQYNLAAVKTHKDKLQNEFSEDSSTDLESLMKRYNKIIDIWTRLGGELNSQFLADWNSKVGKDRTFTIFKAQAGYKYNVELSSMCKKGVPLFEAIDTIVKQEVMKELNLAVLGKAEKEILYDILKQHHFEIPCAICYVEQARQREGVIIDAFLNGKVEQNAKGETTKVKLGWNQVLDSIQKEMKANGVDYSFAQVSRDIATEKYTPANLDMDMKTQAAFYAALKKIANQEIARYNKAEGKSRKLLSDVTPQAVKECFKGTLPANLKIFKVLFEEPSSRFKITSDLLYSSVATQNLSMAHNKLYGLFNSQGGVSGYKTKQGTTIYWGDILGKSWKPDILRNEGGVRNQSNSDFQMYTLLDQAQMYIDFTAKGYYLQAYTKVLSELKLFGLSRGKINASLIPKVVVYLNAAGTEVDVERTMATAGLDENGNPIYDDIEGINHNEAFMLIEDPEYSKSICGICIGYSDAHILKLLDDNRVQQIIGFHDKTDDGSKRYKGAKYAKNYNGLNEAVNKDGKTVHIGFNPYVKKAEKKFKFNAETETFEGTVNYNGKTYTADDIPRLATDLYLEMCAKKGYTPAYKDFAGHRNYYKLLADFGLYDSQGHYAPHRKVVYNMPDTVPYLDANGKKQTMNTYDYIKGELVKELTVRDSISEALADTSSEGIIPQFKAAVKKAQEEKSFSLPKGDQAYMDAVNRGDMVTAQKMVDEAAKAAGYDTVVYHGTPTFGFTKIDVTKSDDQVSFFATDSLEVAETYSGKGNVKGVSDTVHDDMDAIDEAFHDKANDLCEYINRAAGYQSFISYDAFEEYWEDAAHGTLSMDVIRDSLYDDVEQTIQELFAYSEYYDRVNDEDVDQDELYEEFVESEAIDRIYSAVNDLDFILRAARADNGGNYQFYANTDNLFELDAKGNSWSRIPFDEYDKHGFHPYVNTRQAAAYAKANGFDGVKVTNVFDDGGRSPKKQRKPATVYIFFTPQKQVKSADPVTYDDDGNVIPLSERFNADNDDIRYSLPKGEPAPTFYSLMARVVNGLKQEKFGSSTVVSTLRNKGVKAEEIKWSGIEEFLEGKKSVTKAELQEFIAGSMLQIEEETLDNKARPYTDDQQKMLDEYEAKRAEIVKRLADEWKKITGDEFPVRNPGYDLESTVVNKITDANKEYKDATFEGRLLKKLRNDLKKVSEDNDDFGFDSWNDVLRSIHRHRRDFINYYEMSTNDKAIIVKYCNALNAYNELPNKITDADTDRLRTIAREGEQWDRKMAKVVREHEKEQKKYTTSWDQYSLKGGKNYREMLFRIPGSSYSNEAMFRHWDERKGVLAHARVQDMDTFIGKMLFIEEIQSDWHNEGHKEGYRQEGAKTDRMLRRESEKAYEEFYAAVEKMVYDNASWEDDNAVYYVHPVAVAEMFEGNESHFDQYGLTDEQRETIRSMVAEENARQEAMKTAPKDAAAPDAPFKDTYHEYVLKRLLRMAAEQDYDSIGWTTAETQDERWKNDLPHKEGTGKSGFLKAYINEYDQRIKKFLSDFGKKWGTTVGKTVLDNGTEVWSMAITDSMKDSVLYEGQVVYSLPKVTASPSYEELVAKKPIAVIDIGRNDDGLSYAELKDMVLKDARERKIFDVPHPNRDTKVMIFLTEQSFTHAFSNLTSTFGEDTILAMGHIPEIIQEAVLTHIAPPKNLRKAESRVFTFFAAIDGKNGIEPVKLTVKEYVGRKLSEIPQNIRRYFEENGEQETHNRLYDAEVLEVIAIEGTKKESGASASVANRKRLGAKGTPNSTIKIADLIGLVNGEERKHIPLPATEDVGYHAGDLGKAEFLHQQGYGRGTGHFGTGTYFVGDKSKIEDDGDYASRPHHAVDFKDYNLYKIRNDKDGYDLHSSLRVIDGGFSQEFLDAAVADKFSVSELRHEAHKLLESYDTQEWDEELEMYFSKDYIGSSIRAYTEVAKNNGVEVQSYDAWLAEQGDDIPKPGDSDYESYKYEYHDYLKETIEQADKERNSGYPKFRDAYFDLWLRFGIRGKNVESALRKTLAYQNSFSDAEISAMRKDTGVDSLATVFMKNMGYEGIDVRGTGLDNTAYGSVIYDLRKDSVYYKLPVGEDTSPRALLANAFEGIITNDIEKRKIQEYKGNVEMLNAEEQKLHELRAQIKKLSFAKGKRDTKKIKDLQFDAIQTANRIATLDKILLRLEVSAPLQSILQREKEMAYKRAEQKGKEALEAYKKAERERDKQWQSEVKEKYQASKKKAIETREKREAREKLQKLVLDTVKWITYPSKTDVKCPDILKQPYADFLNGIDLSSKRLADGGDPTKNDLRLANAMGSLATALDKIMTSQDPNQETEKVLDTGYLDLPANFVQKLRDMTENVKAMMVDGDYVVNNMSAAEVRQLSQMIRTLNHAIKEVSTLYANLRFANVESLGHNTMSFMDDLGEIDKTSGMKDFVQWENALPYYAFKRFGEGGESVFEGLMDAQDKLAFLAQEIFDFRDKAWTDKEAKEWSEDTHTITLPDGNPLTLTTADAMSIYCLSRREQGLQHLLGGGTRVVGIQKGSQKAKDSRSTLTIQDISAINSSLTDRQIAVADAIQSFMSTVCSEWGNEISMKRFLTKEFNEKFYFPIESNDENLPTKDPAAQQSDLFRLLNISATKPLTPGANNEVIIRNIFDVFTGHASDMARLNAYGMALLDYMKWLNYREKTVNNDGQIKVRGVRKSMEKAYGNAAKSYVLNLVKDVNGRPSDGGDPTILMKWMRNAKTASVGANLRVAALQFTSYPRAALVLSTRSIALGLTKAPQVAKAKKYCGIALWKSFGFYDTNIARSIEDQMKGVTNIRQKIIELSMKGAEWGDAITWGCLWNACEYEVAQTTKNKVGSEEFYQEVGKKLREVVYATQVVDSTLTRSQLMRSKRGMAQEAASFMSEPTLTTNILMDAGFQFEAEKRRTGSVKAAWDNTGKHIGRAVAVYSCVALLGALVESLGDAWRDDDEEEFYEKFFEALPENVLLNLLPFNKVPIVSDVFELALSLLDVGFFSSEKLSTQWLSQTATAVDAWGEVFSGKSTATVYGALYKTVKALSSTIGVPFSGALREVVALWNNTAGSFNSAWKLRTYGQTQENLRDGLYDAIVSGNQKQVESIQEEFRKRADNDKDYQSTITAAIRKALRDNDPRIKEAAQAVVDGNAAERANIAREIAAEGHFSLQDIQAAINAEIDKIRKEAKG